MSETYKELGNVAPAASTDTLLYTCPVDCSAIVTTLTVGNTNATAVTFSYAVVNGVVIDLAPSDWVVYQVPLSANNGFTAHNITLAEGYSLVVRASATLVNFHAFGVEFSGVIGGSGGDVSPSSTVASETSWGVSPSAGDSLDYSRGNHTHGTPANPVTTHEASYSHANLEHTTNKGAASGYASLNSSSLVIENPANATATPTASKIPVADGSGKLDGWVTGTPDADASTKGKIQLAGQLGGTAASPTVVGVTESGATALSIGSITDASFVKRSSNSLIGADLYEDLVFAFDGGGYEIADNATIWRQINFSCTIISWTLMANASGSIQLDIWKDTLANYPPTVDDKITGSAKPIISSATQASSSTLTGWTTAITAGDVIKVIVDSCTTIQTCVLCLKVKR